MATTCDELRLDQLPEGLRAFPWHRCRDTSDPSSAIFLFDAISGRACCPGQRKTEKRSQPFSRKWRQILPGISEQQIGAGKEGVV